MNNRAFAVFAYVIGITLLGVTSCGQKTPQGHYVVNNLSILPDPINISITPDSRHIMYVKTHGSKKQVVFDTTAGPEFDGVYVDNTFVTTSDMKRIGYAIATNKAAPGDCATCGPPGKWRAVIDSQFGPEYDKVGGITFNHDGSSVAYNAMKKKKDGRVEWITVINGKEVPGTYEAVSFYSPKFGPDGKNVYNVAKKKNGKSIVVVNDTEGVEFDKIGYGIPFLSADGKHFAYTGINYVGNGAVVVLDGKAGPNFDVIPETSLVFSPDSKHFSYGTHTGSNWQVIADGKPQSKYAQVDNIIYSSDSKYLSYKAQKGNKWTVVVNGKEGVLYDSLMNGFPVYSPDRQYLAYSFKKNGKWKIAVEEVKTRKNAGERYFTTEIKEGYDEITSCTFSPDSKRLSFVAREGRKKVVFVDGKKVGDSYDDIVKSPVFSPDGKRMAYLAKIKRGDNDSDYIVVVDGKAGPECNAVLKEDPSVIVFSADSKHVGYAASIDGKWCLVINGQKGPEPFETICNLVNSAKGGFESLVVNKKALYRVNWYPDNAVH